MGRVKLVRFQSAALLETIVSFMIIAIIFGIVTSFLVQVGPKSFSLRDTRATQLLNKYAAETDEKKAFFDEQLDNGDVYITREVVRDEINKDLIRVKFGIYDRNRKLIASHQRLFYFK